MIDDKVAKMAVNTLKKYCNTNLKTCNKCAVKDACCMSSRVFGNMDKINDVGTFEDWQKHIEKTPKFDEKLRGSLLFWSYMNKILKREADKAGLFAAGVDKIKCYPNGTIKVWYTDEDGETVYKGKAKCHPNDAFNPEIGIKLAVQRIVEKLNKPFIPTDGEAYYYVDDENLIYSTINHNSNKDALNIAVGNCFRKYKEAEANAAVIMKRIKKAAELLKKLRDEYRGEGMM